MDRAMLVSHLEQAERHVVVKTKNVRRQRELIAELERDGKAFGWPAGIRSDQTKHH